MSASWLDEARKRGQQNAQEATTNADIARNLQERDAAFARITRMQEQPVRLLPNEVRPKMAPRTASHAARPMRSYHRARPATLEERRDDAVTDEYCWLGIERTAPDFVRRQYL